MSISLFRMPAAATPLTGVLRVDSDHLHAEGIRLVADKLFQLIKGPAVEIGALRFAQPASVANTAQIFYRYRRVAGVLGKLDDTAANDVVRISHKAPLSARQPSQGSPRGAAARSCLFLLERSAGFGVAVANMMGMPATEEKLTFAVGDGRQYIDTPVYAHHGIIGFIKSFNFAFKRDRQVNFALDDKQAAIAHFPLGKIFKKFRLAVEGNAFDTPAHSPEADAVVPEAKVTAPLTALKGYRTLLGKCYGALEFNLFCSRRCILARHVTNRILRHLGRKPKAGANIAVNQPMQMHGIGKTPPLESGAADVIARRRPRLSGALDRISTQSKPDFGRAYNFHREIIPHYVLLEKLKGGREFPCHLKTAVPFA